MEDAVDFIYKSFFYPGICKGKHSGSSEPIGMSTLARHFEVCIQFEPHMGDQQGSPMKFICIKDVDVR